LFRSARTLVTTAKDNGPLNIAIFGLGYVGCVSAACLAESGIGVIGVDVNPAKVEALRRGRSPIVEPGIDALLARHVASGRLRVTEDAAMAVRECDLSMICVGTPGRANGSLDLSYVRAVCDQIGDALRDRDGFHGVVIRSTLLPGSVGDELVPRLERQSGRAAGESFAVAINPEFLREGTAIHDYRHPPFTLIGSDDDRLSRLLRQVYCSLTAPLIELSVREAEMVKYACNCFHAVKVGFANEIGNLCKALGIDSHAVMDAFCRDDKLNLSAYYLRPGFAFGGSCLPKDLRAINYRARELDVDTPLLASVLRSNERQVALAFERITARPCRRIALLGLSFKAGTDDLRESPMVALAERLIGRGYTLRIHDREVQIARLTGANKAYIEGEIPHLSRLMTETVEEAVADAEVIVVAKKDAQYASALAGATTGRRIVDLVRLEGLDSASDGYDGICW
jgi:GDP-mannose 6-dehydrogenase